MTQVTGDMIYTSDTSDTSDTGKMGDWDDEGDERYFVHGGEEGQKGFLAEKIGRRDTFIYDGHHMVIVK